jgi:hypothetical protein
MKGGDSFHIQVVHINNALRLRNSSFPDDHHLYVYSLVMLVTIVNQETSILYNDHVK